MSLQRRRKAKRRLQPINDSHMQILKVEGSLVCSSRIPGLDHTALRVLVDIKGKRQVASDHIGAEPGNWVFVASGTAGRYAVNDPELMTDLAICGIIDKWSEEDMIVDT